MMDQESEYAYRINCFRELCKRIFCNKSFTDNITIDDNKEYEILNKLDVYSNSIVCCENCSHSCISCKEEECLKKPDCSYRPCEDCGLKECHKVIGKEECIEFVRNKTPFKSFPYCKKFSQIFDCYVENALENFSSYCIKTGSIDLNHKDNLMYARLVHRLPIDQLQLLFEKIMSKPCGGNDQIETGSVFVGIVFLW